MLNKLKNYVPTSFKKKLKRSIAQVNSSGSSKIFCISMQRTGTTSVGDFLEDHGISVARNNDSRHYRWSYLYSIGDLESIFNSKAFNSYQAFEDGPWFMPDFYKILNHRFPESKFILFYRDSDDWFDSMIKHSGGKTLGNTRRHCKIYRRMTEFYNKLDSDPTFEPEEIEIDNLMTLEGKREHYIQVYDEYNREVKEYFSKYAPNKLFASHLENSEKWKKLGDFLNIEVDNEYSIHSNKSAEQ